MRPLADQLVSHLRLVDPRDPGAGDHGPGREAHPVASLPAHLPSPGSCSHPGGRGEHHPPGRHRTLGDHRPEPAQGVSGSAAGGAPPIAPPATQTTPGPQGSGRGVGRTGRAHQVAAVRAHPVRLTARGQRVARAAGWLLIGALASACAVVLAAVLTAAAFLAWLYL